MTDRERFEHALTDGLHRMNLAVPQHAVEKLGRHYALLVRWAKRINLTTVTDPVAAAYRHALDCLLFAEFIEPDASLEAVDVGSGGGFPGLVIAVVRPRVSLTLLEPIRKRTSFLRVAAAELEVPVRVVEGKLTADSAGAPWPTDLIVSRATIPPLDLVGLAGRGLRPGGRLVLSGGQGRPSEAAVREAADRAGLVHQARRAYVLPDDAPRWLDAFARPGHAAEHG